MRRWSIISLVLLVLIIVVGVGIFMQERSRVLSFPANAWYEDRSADCAVVLTGGAGRVREGFDLLSQGRIKKLIISGVYPKARLREIFPEWPFYGPISEDDVILEKRSGTTYGNAQQSQPLVEALKCHSVILITSNLHMYRSYRIFQAAFPKEIQIFPRAIVAGRIHPAFLDVSLETIKSIFYSLFAY